MTASLPKRFKLIGQGGAYKKVYDENVNGVFVIPKHISTKLNNKQKLLLSVENPNVIKNEIELQTLFATHNLSPMINSNFLRCNRIETQGHQGVRYKLHKICRQNAFFYVEKMTSFQDFKLKNKDDIEMILNSFMKKTIKLAQLGYFNLDLKEENMVIKISEKDIINRFIKRCHKLEKRNYFSEFKNTEDTIFIKYKVAFSKNQLFDKFIKRIGTLSKAGHVTYTVNLNSKTIKIFKRKKYEVFFIDIDPFFYIKLKTNSKDLQRANILMSLLYLVLNQYVNYNPKGTRLFTFKNTQNKEILFNYVSKFLVKNGYMFNNTIVLTKIHQDIILLHNKLLEIKTPNQFALANMIKYYLLPMTVKVNRSEQIINEFILNFRNIMKDKYNFL